jgi:hypothetical protein
VMAGGGIDLHEVALAEILDPRGVKGKHSRTFCSWYVPRKRAGRVLVNRHRVTACSLRLPDLAAAVERQSGASRLCAIERLDHTEQAYLRVRSWDGSP